MGNKENKEEFTSKDGEILYKSGTGIYRYNKTNENYDTLFGPDLSPANGTSTIHPTPINDSVLKSQGFSFDSKSGEYTLGNLKIKRNIDNRHFEAGEKILKNLNDLEEYLQNNGNDLVFNQDLLDAFS